VKQGFLKPVFPSSDLFTLNEINNVARGLELQRSVSVVPFIV